MSFLAYMRILERGYYDLIRAIRIYSNRGYENSLMSIGKENTFTGKSEEGFNASKDYLLRRHQDRGKHDKRTRVCQYQKALLKRINKEIKGLEVKIEEDIQEAFSRKIRSRRWNKRHHYLPL